MSDNELPPVPLTLVKCLDFSEHPATTVARTLLDDLGETNYFIHTIKYTTSNLECVIM